MLRNLLYVGLGGFGGAIARYVLSGWLYQLFGSSFPFGTVGVNLLGSFLIGIFAGFSDLFFWDNPQMRLLFLVGFLGSFTTFSTFTYESFSLARNDQWLLFGIYCGVHLFLGFFAVYLGFNLVKLMMR